MPRSLTFLVIVLASAAPAVYGGPIGYTLDVHNNDSTYTFVRTGATPYALLNSSIGTPKFDLAIDLGDDGTFGVGDKVLQKGNTVLSLRMLDDSPAFLTISDLKFEIGDEDDYLAGKDIKGVRHITSGSFSWILEMPGMDPLTGTSEITLRDKSLFNRVRVRDDGTLALTLKGHLVDDLGLNMALAGPRATPVPEPGTLVLGALGIGAVALRRRVRRKK